MELHPVSRKARIFTNEDGVTLAAVPGFDRLYATADGRLWSDAKVVTNTSKTGKRFAQDRKAFWHDTAPNSTGYPIVRLNGKIYLVHRLILAAFTGENHEHLLALHRNDDRSDCSLANLYWGTYSENFKDSVRNGRRDTSFAHVYRGRDLCAELKPHLEAGLPVYKAAEIIGISHAVAYAALKRQNRG